MYSLGIFTRALHDGFITPETYSIFSGLVYQKYGQTSVSVGSTSMGSTSYTGIICRKVPPVLNMGGLFLVIIAETIQYHNYLCSISIVLDIINNCDNLKYIGGYG